MSLSFWISEAERMPDAVDKIFLMEQYHEVNVRTRRLARRLYPAEPAPSAFLDPQGFVEASIRDAGRRARIAKVRERIMGKIVRRDLALSIIDKARRIAASEKGPQA